MFDVGSDVRAMLRVRSKMEGALNGVADKPISDMGGGLGGFDLWVWIDGKEWSVSVSETGRDAPHQS